LDAARRIEERGEAVQHLLERHFGDPLAQ
jgi:hypothetical protein